jgi:hypothetical protein
MHFPCVFYENRQKNSIYPDGFFNNRQKKSKPSGYFDFSSSGFSFSIGKHCVNVFLFHKLSICLLAVVAEGLLFYCCSSLL